MAIWEAAANEVLYNAFNQLGQPEVLDSYPPTANFLRDYVSYVNILGIFPHPKIVTNLRGLLDDISKEDELARARANVKKKPVIKKPVIKKGVVLEEAPSRGKSRISSQRDDSDAKKEEGSPPELLELVSLSHLLYNSISIKNWKVDNGTARGLSLALQHSTSVRSLAFYNTEISDISLQFTLEAISRNSTLQSLSLSVCTNFPPLLPSLPPTTFSNLQHISLQSNELDDISLHTLLEHISPSVSLTALDLWDNRIGDSGASSLALLLRTNTTLTSLSLGKNCVGDEGAENIASNLGRYPLPAEETANRKKLKADLEFKKKENERRKRKGPPPTSTSPNPPPRTKSQDKAVGGGHPDKNLAVPDKNGADKNGAPSPDRQRRKPGKKTEPTLDEQIAALQPAEEIDGVWYVDGNRTLLNINLRMNRITDKGAASIFRMIQVNPVLERCVAEYNPVSDDMQLELLEAFIRRDQDEQEEGIDMGDFEPEQPLVYTQDPSLVI